MKFNFNKNLKKENVKMKITIKRLSILVILVSVFTLTTPITRVSFAQTCADGVDCPSDNDNAGDGPKSPPPKDTSILCKWLGICTVN